MKKILALVLQNMILSGVLGAAIVLGFMGIVTDYLLQSDLEPPKLLNIGSVSYVTEPISVSNSSSGWPRFASRGSPLFEGDKFKTGSHSARLSIGEAKITLGPYSSIQLQKNLSMQNGWVHIDTGEKPTQIHLQDFGNIEANAKSLFLITQNDGFPPVINALSGKLNVKWQQQNLAVQGQEKLVWNNKGEPEVKTNSVHLLGPNPLGKKTPGFFSWKRPEKITFFLLQISRSLDFQQPIFQKTLRGNSHVFEAPTESEFFYWRLLGHDGKSYSLSSPIGLWQSAGARPHPLYPEAKKSQTSRQVVFAWSGGRQFPVALQISETRDFSSVLTSPVVTRPGYKAEIASFGTFYWRASFQFPDHTRRWTPASEFFLGGRPKLLQPSPDQYFQKTFVTPVELKWESSSEHRRFDLQVGTDREFVNPSYRTTLDGRNMQWAPAQFGRFYWRTRESYSDTQHGPWSKTRMFEVQLPFSKIPRPAFDKSLKGAEFLLSFVNPVSPEQVGSPPIKSLQGFPYFRWTGSEQALGGYWVQVAKDPKIEKVVFNNVVQSPVAYWNRGRPGVYYVQVSAIDIDGRRTRPTPAFRFSISTKSPEPLETQIQEGEKKQITLFWAPGPYSELFHSEIQSRDEPNRPALSKKEKGPSVSFSLPPPGKYYWHVRPLNKNFLPIGEFSAKIFFEIQQDRTLSSVEKENPTGF